MQTKTNDPASNNKLGDHEATAVSCFALRRLEIMFDSLANIYVFISRNLRAFVRFMEEIQVT